MTLICENKISAEVRLIHAKQISLYNFIILRKKQWTQMKTKQLKQDILNQQKSIGFPKLIYGLLETRNYMHALREYESASSN